MQCVNLQTGSAANAATTTAGNEGTNLSAANLAAILFAGQMFGSENIADMGNLPQFTEILDNIGQIDTKSENALLQMLQNGKNSDASELQNLFAEQLQKAIENGSLPQEFDVNGCSEQLTNKIAENPAEFINMMQAGKQNADININSKPAQPHSQLQTAENMQKNIDTALPMADETALPQIQETEIADTAATAENYLQPAEIAANEKTKPAYSQTEIRNSKTDTHNNTAEALTNNRVARQSENNSGNATNHNFTQTDTQNNTDIQLNAQNNSKFADAEKDDSFKTLMQTQMNTAVDSQRQVENLTPAAKEPTQMQDIKQQLGVEIKELGKHISESIKAGGNEETQNITVRLSPPELGKITITVRQQDKNIDASIETERIETKSQLQQAMGHIAKSLSDSGISLRNYEVKNSEQFRPNTESSFTEQNQSPDSQSQQQSQQWHRTASTVYEDIGPYNLENFAQEQNFSNNFYNTKSVNMLV